MADKVRREMLGGLHTVHADCAGIDIGKTTQVVQL